MLNLVRGEESPDHHKKEESLSKAKEIAEDWYLRFVGNFAVERSKTRRPFARFSSITYKFQKQFLLFGALLHCSDFASATLNLVPPATSPLSIANDLLKVFPRMGMLGLP